MPTQVIVLNGTSSSGKTTLARALQAVLPDPWLTFGIDTLLGALPATGTDIAISADGEVTNPAKSRPTPARFRNCCYEAIRP